MSTRMTRSTNAPRTSFGIMRRAHVEPSVPMSTTRVLYTPKHSWWDDITESAEGLETPRNHTLRSVKMSRSYAMAGDQALNDAKFTSIPLLALGSPLLPDEMPATPAMPTTHPNDDDRVDDIMRQLDYHGAHEEEATEALQLERLLERQRRESVGSSSGSSEANTPTSDLEIWGEGVLDEVREVCEWVQNYARDMGMD